MARYTRAAVGTIQGVNTELTKVQQAINDTLSRKGDVPNQMEATLDMNSERIINLPAPVSDHEPFRKGDLPIIEATLQPYVDAAEASADRAEQEADRAEAEAASATQEANRATVEANKAEQAATIAVQYPEGQLAAALATPDSAVLVGGVEAGELQKYFTSMAQLRATAGVKNGQIANLISYHDGWAAVNLPPVGGGDFYWDAAATDADDNISVYGAFAVGRWRRRGISRKIDITWAGAKPDNTYDSTDALEAARDYAQKTDRRGSVVFVPAGMFKITRKVIFGSGVTLEGVYEKGAVAFPLSYAGSHLIYHGQDGDIAIQFGTGLQAQYHNKIKKIRIGYTGGVNKPAAGVAFIGCSEFTLEQVHINGACKVGILIDTSTIGRINNFDLAVNEVGIKIQKTISLPNFPSPTSIHIRNGNLWECSNAALHIVSSALDISVTDTWMEYCQDFIKFEQTSNVLLSVNRFNLQRVQGTNGSAYTESRFIKAVAFGGGNTALTVNGLTVRDCLAFNASSTYNIEYVKGTNTAVNSFIANAHIEDCIWYGASTSVMFSDTGNTTAHFSGAQDARNGFAAGSAIPLSTGAMRRTELINKFGLLDMSGGYPLKLPQTAPISFTDPGQIWFSAALQRVRFTDTSGTPKSIPVPAEAQSNSTATDVAALVSDFNSLLGKLRTAGVILT